MKKWTDGARWRAIATAALLVVAGGVGGVLMDRFWLSSPRVEPSPLTADAMAARLGLSSAEKAHVRALLDSLHVEILAAAQHGPDSLRPAVLNATQRIEAALPPSARPEFRAWIDEHHRQLMGRTHGRGGH